MISVGWQENPDLDKIAELKPDLILMTGEKEDFYEAETFDKRGEMKKDLDRVDAKEAVFEENVKAKFGDQKLMYLSVTDNDIRYYAYGHFGYLYDTYHFNRA